MGNKQTIFTDEQLDAYQVSLHGCVCILHVGDCWCLSIQVEMRIKCTVNNLGFRLCENCRVICVNFDFKSQSFLYFPINPVNKIENVLHFITNWRIFGKMVII